MNLQNVELGPLWVSTPDHLRLFDAVADNASTLERWTRNYPPFDGFTFHRRANGKREPVSFIAI